MKFVFPRNYNFNTKLFGVIDYFTIIINIIFDFFIFSLSNLIFNNININFFMFSNMAFKYRWLK